MKNYICYIKSHSEAPDFEQNMLAGSKEEAAKLFTLFINLGNPDPWTEKDVAKHVEEL